MAVTPIESMATRVGNTTKSPSKARGGDQITSSQLQPALRAKRGTADTGIACLKGSYATLASMLRQLPPNGKGHVSSHFLHERECYKPFHLRGSLSVPFVSRTHSSRNSRLQQPHRPCDWSDSHCPASSSARQMGSDSSRSSTAHNHHLQRTRLPPPCVPHASQPSDNSHHLHSYTDGQPIAR